MNPARGTAWSYLHTLQNFIHSSEMKMHHSPEWRQGQEKDECYKPDFVAILKWPERLTLQQHVNKETLLFLTTTLYFWNYSAFFLFLLEAIISWFMLKIYWIFNPIYWEISEVFGALLISWTSCLEVHICRRQLVLLETHQTMKLRYDKWKVSVAFLN